MRDLAPEHPALIQHLPVVRLPRQAVAALRAQALADIVTRWKEKNWWDNTTGRSAKKPKPSLEELLKASSSHPLTRSVPAHQVEEAHGP